MNTQNDRKFYVPGLVLAGICGILSFAGFLIESIVIGIITLILDCRNRKTKRTALSVVITVISIISSVAWLIFQVYTCSDGNTSTDYWFVNLIT